MESYFHMNNRPTSFIRQHRGVNRYMTKGVLHPDTVERLRVTGLTISDFEKANERRHWIALLRILRVSARIGQASLRRLAKESRADWRTCKEALKHTIDFVLDKVREALVCSGSRVANYINTKGRSHSASRENKNSGAGLNGMIQRCLALAEACSGSEKKNLPPAPLGNTSRKQQERELAQRIQAENEAKNAQTGYSGASLVMNPRMMKIYLKRHEEPSVWRDLKEWMDNQLMFRKKKQEKFAKKDQWPNCAAYRELPNATSGDRKSKSSRPGTSDNAKQQYTTVGERNIQSSSFGKIGNRSGSSCTNWTRLWRSPEK